MAVDPTQQPLRDLLDILGVWDPVQQALQARTPAEKKDLFNAANSAELTSEIVSRLRVAIEKLSSKDRTTALRQTFELIRRFRVARATGPLELKTFGLLLMALVGGTTLELDPTATPVAMGWMKDNAFKQPRATGSPPLLLTIEEGSYQRFDPDPASIRATGVQRGLTFLNDSPSLSVLLVVTDQDDLLHVLSKQDAVGRSVVHTLDDATRWDPVMVRPDTLHSTPTPLPSQAVAVTAIAPTRSSVERSWTEEDLAGLPERFAAWLKNLRVEVDVSTGVDVLAAFLSSQFVMFAGPSGTGKSTLARAVTEYFTPPDSIGLIDGRRQLIGPEDVVGYFSAFNEKFAFGLDFEQLWRISGGDDGSVSPVLIVDEINLSPVEGYLSPFVHGLSAPSVRQIVWSIVPGENPDESIPSELTFTPFPRMLGTINVDATALAPAKKVTARACVVLLEPEPSLSDEVITGVAASLTGPQSVADSLYRGALSGSAGSEDARFVGDPLQAIRQLASSEVAPFTKAIGRRLGELSLISGEDSSSGENVVSRRQSAQAVAYGAWFRGLARDLLDSEEATRVTAENAYLHFVLPSLSPDDFARNLEGLRDLDDGPSTGGELRSVLWDRVRRLHTSDVGDLYGANADFWDRLS